MEIKYKVASIIMAGSLLVPTMVGAAEPDRMTAKATAATTNNFCINLTTLQSQITERLSSGENKLGSRQQEIQGKATDRKNKRSEDLVASRVKADAEREAAYDQLTAKATSDAQKTAVATYKSTIEAAIVTRRTAVDEAVSAYWSAVSDVITNRQGAVTTAEQNFKNAIDTAVSTATAECANGTAPQTARQHFTASIQTAKQKFATDRKAIDKYGPQIKALVQTRNGAVKKAFDAFRATAEQARKDLKAAFAK